MPCHICVITCFLCVTMGFVHDEYSLVRVESLLVHANPFIGGKRVYHDDINYGSIIFRILSSVPCLCWHDLFWSCEKFLFVSFSHYSLVVRTHMDWHMWHVFSIVISFVPPYYVTSLLTHVIHHNCGVVHYSEPIFTSRYQSVFQILHRFPSYSVLAS